MVRWMSRSACVVTSPMTTQRPLVIAVSHATRAWGSCASIPSNTASETWSQTLSGCPSVTDSDVRRKDRDELKDVVTNADDNLRLVSGSVVVPRVLRLLTEQLGLHREDIVEDAVDAPALEPVLDQHAGPFEVLPERNAKWPVHAALAPDLSLLEQLQTPIQRELFRLVGGGPHSVPSTSTRPAAVTRAYTLFNAD